MNERFRIIGKLSSEDRVRYLQIHATLTGIAYKPEAYSREEIEQAYLKEQNFCADVIRQFDIDEAKEWALNAATGAVSVED